MSNRNPILFENFVRDLIGSLKEAGIVKVRQVDDSLLITMEGGEMRVNLNSIYETYESHTAESRPIQMAGFVSMIARGVHGNSKLDLNFEKVLRMLKPKIYPRWTWVSQQLEGLPADGVLDSMPHRLIGEHLLLTLAMDYPDSIQSVNKEDLKQWELSFDTALQIGLENLKNKTSLVGFQPDNGLPGFGSHSTMDNFDSSRFLLDFPYEGYHIGLPRWAFVLGRDICFLAQADQEEHLCTSIEMAFSVAKKDPKPLPPFPITFDGHNWKTWIPTKGSKPERLLAKAQHEYLMSTYENQTALLKYSAVRRKDFALVQALQRDEQSIIKIVPKTYTYWNEKTINLLPTADSVIFPERDYLTVPFEHLISKFPEFISPAESLYPARWRTNGIPTKSQLKSLPGCHVGSK